MRQCYVTIKNGKHKISGYSDELSKFITFDNFIKLVSQPNFVSLTITVSSDPVIPDHHITLMKV